MAECAFCACAGCVYFWCVALSLGLLQPLPRPVRERAGPDRCPVPCPSRSAVTGPHTAPHGARRGSISVNEDSEAKGYEGSGESASEAESRSLLNPVGCDWLLFAAF